MRKLFFSILLMAFALSLGACTDGKPLDFGQLPQNAQTTITKYFSKEEILLIRLDKDDLLSEYEVKLKDGTELEFDRNGALTKIDCQQKRVPDELSPEEVITYVNTRRVPDGLVTEKVLAYVNANHPNAFITEWSKDDMRWKAELNNGLELVFNNNGKFLRYDD